MLLKKKRIVEALEPGLVGHNHPVDHVNWDDAVEFCKRLSEMPDERKAGHVYWLPTEAEWEYACRAGTTSAYNTGDSKNRLEQAGWYRDNAGSKPIDSEKKFREAKGNIKQYALGLIANGNTPHPVGRKKPNAWGYLPLPGFSGGDGSGEVRGVSVVGFERDNVLFFDCAWNFDGTANRSTKFLLGLQGSDIIALRETGWSDRLQWCGLQGLGSSAA